MLFFFFKQKTAYEMRISDWSSDVCSSDLWAWAKSPSRRRRTSCACSTRYRARRLPTVGRPDAPDAGAPMKVTILGCGASPGVPRIDGVWGDCDPAEPKRSEEHTSELQSLMRISYAVFCLKKKKKLHKQLTSMSLTINNDIYTH